MHYEYTHYVESVRVAGALYRQVYETLRDEILAGEHPVGERLPSEEQLRQRFGVSVITIKRGLDLLRADGFIIRRPRVGTVVVSDVATSSPPQRAASLPLIGCVLTNFDDTFGTHVLGGVLDASNGAANVVVKRSLGNGELEDEVIRGLVSVGVQALILQPSSSEYVPPSVLELVTSGFPVVILDRAFDGVPVSTVCSDNVSAAKRATEHLFSLGHDRVGLVTSSSHVSTISDRHEGFVHAHAEFHVPHDPANDFRSVRSTIPGSTGPPAEDIERLAEYLAAHDQLTGLVAAEYSIAVLLREACERLGRSVPNDVSIVCFDHPDPFPSFLFHFAHMRQDQQGMGVAALGQAIAQVRDARAVKKISLATELVVGDSTATRPRPSET